MFLDSAGEAWVIFAKIEPYLEGIRKRVSNDNYLRHLETLLMRQPNAVETCEVRRETIFLRLRQTEGIDYDDVVRLCGAGGTEWIERGLEDGWLRRDGPRVAFTPAGFLLSNDYITQLF